MVLLVPQGVLKVVLLTVLQLVQLVVMFLVPLIVKTGKTFVMRVFKGPLLFVDNKVLVVLKTLIA